MELALEAGAEDFKADPQGYEIITDPAHFEAVHKQVEAKGIKPAVAEVTQVPTRHCAVAERARRWRGQQAARGARRPR